MFVRSIRFSAPVVQWYHVLVVLAAVTREIGYRYRTVDFSTSRHGMRQSKTATDVDDNTAWKGPASTRYQTLLYILWARLRPTLVFEIYRAALTEYAQWFDLCISNSVAPAHPGRVPPTWRDIIIKADVYGIGVLFKESQHWCSKIYQV